MITFIYGASGSGKSDFIMRAIENCASNGKTAYLIVPEQQAVIREDEIARTVEPSVQSCVEVLNFTRTANRVFRKFGGLSYNYADRMTRSLVMWDALHSCAPFLKKYGTVVSSNRGISQTVELMLSTVRSCKMYGVSASELETAAHTLAADEIREGASPGKTSSLPERLTDLALVYSAYDELLHSRCDDPDDDLDALAKTLETHDFFVGTDVFVDAFYSYTPAEYSVLRRIFSQADNVTLTFCMPYGSKRAEFAHIKAAADKLSQLASDAKCEVETLRFDTDTRHNSHDIAYAASNLWNFSAPCCTEQSKAVEIFKCRDPYEQAQYAAYQIEKWVREGQGCVKYGDIAVVIRGSGDFEGILDTALEKQHIPFYFSRRSGLSNHPAAALLTRALAVIADNYRREDVLGYIKTGLVRTSEDGTVNADDIDSFAAYVNMWGVTGSRMKSTAPLIMNPDGFTDVISEEGAKLLETVNRVRRVSLGILDTFSSLGKSAPVSDWCRASYEFLMACNVPKQLDLMAERAKKSGDNAGSMLHSQIWDALVNCLECAHGISGTTETDADGFEAMMRLLFSSSDVGTIPTGSDEVVIGDASMLRVSKPRCAILLGVNEGVFPAAGSDNSDFFSDVDIIRLEGAGLSIGEYASSPAELRASREFFFAARAFAVPSDKLALAYTETDASGGERRPSQIINRIVKLLPDVKVTAYGSVAPWERIYTVAAAKDYISAHPGNDVSGAFLKALKGVVPDDEYDFLSHSASAEQDSERYGDVGADAAGVMFGRRIGISASRLEAYASCPYAFWCRYGAKLCTDDKRREFKSADVGNFIHGILEILVSRLVLPNGIFRTPADSELDTLCDEAVNDYVNEVFSTQSASSNRMKYLIRRLRRCVRLFAASICEEFAESNFLPRYFELPVGMNGKSSAKQSVPPLTYNTPDGSAISLYGKIDRVDTIKKDGVTYVRVTDYKTGQAAFRAENIAAGLGLQLLLYLFALWKCPDGNFKNDLSGGGEIYPSGMLYFLVNPPEVTVSPGENNVREVENNSLRRDGLIIDRTDIIEEMEPGVNGRFIPVKLKKDGAFTAASSVCSLDRFGELYNEVSDAVVRIASEMKDGVSEANPTDVRRCEYCDFKQSCPRHTDAM